MTTPSRHAELLAEAAIPIRLYRAREVTVRPEDLQEALRVQSLVNRLAAALTAETARHDAPIPMILFCPACGLQHIDAPEGVSAPAYGLGGGVIGERRNEWTNPPHRSHLCRTSDGGCGHIWRPADVPTTGVAAIETKGSADSVPVDPRARHDALRAGVEGLVAELETLAAEDVYHPNARRAAWTADAIRLRALLEAGG